MSAVLYDAVGPRGRRRILLSSITGAIVLAGLLWLAYRRMAANNALDAERWEVLGDPDLQELLGRALVTTL